MDYIQLCTWCISFLLTFARGNYLMDPGQSSDPGSFIYWPVTYSTGAVIDHRLDMRQDEMQMRNSTKRLPFFLRSYQIGFVTREFQSPTTGLKDVWLSKYNMHSVSKIRLNQKAKGIMSLKYSQDFIFLPEITPDLIGTSVTVGCRSIWTCPRSHQLISSHLHIYHSNLIAKKELITSFVKFRCCRATLIWDTCKVCAKTETYMTILTTSISSIIIR